MINIPTIKEGMTILELEEATSKFYEELNEMSIKYTKELANYSDNEMVTYAGARSWLDDKDSGAILEWNKGDWIFIIKNGEFNTFKSKIDEAGLNIENTIHIS